MPTASTQYDAIIVGGGHNGLVAGAYLARGGLRTLILERNERVGGGLATGALAPGVRVPTVAHTVGRLRASVVSDLGLRSHGLVSLRPAVRAFAPHSDGRAVTLWADPVRTAEELGAWSQRDAAAYPRFDRKVRALASFLAHLNITTPPDIKSPSVSDALEGFRLSRAIRGLGRPAHAREALRVLPMAVADLVGEVFESDAVRAILAARGIQYTAMGPWSSGTAAVLLSDSAGNDGGAAGQTVFAQGGPGALAEALEAAARANGAAVQTETEVVRILSRGDRVTGVALASGAELVAPVVVSAVDPKRTLLGMVDPVVLGPHLAWRAGNIRMPGTVAKVNLALSGVPRFPAAGGEEDRLHGRIVVAPGIDALERAFDQSKYGQVSGSPYLEATIPSLMDPTLVKDGTHAMSILVQYAPYHRREGHWDTERDRLGDLVLATLEGHAPGISDLVTARQVLTPLDLERDHGLTEGHPLHGEPGLDQFFAWRPLWGLARYRLPLDGLYLCGAGAHPGGGITGGPGANAAREILTDEKRRR